MNINAFIKNKVLLVKMTTDGCDDCGLAYSFYFGKQFHKKGCKAGGGRRDNDEDGVHHSVIKRKNHDERTL